MFKGRLGVWIITIILCVSASGLCKWVPTWFDSEDVTVMVDVKNDIGLNEVVSNSKYSGIKLIQKDSNTEIIITDRKQTIEGYKKYENQLNSPLVMYVSGDLSNHGDGFIKVADNNSVNKVDLYSILKGLENNKKWEDLGFSEKTLKGDIKLYIPNEQSTYYDDIIDLFYVTLNLGDVPTDEQRKTLKEEVDKIIAKCNKVVDINQSIYDEYSEGSKNKIAFIGPEFLYRRGAGASMGNNSSDSFKPIYFMKTVFIYSDIFIKETEEEEKENIGEKFIESITKKDKFMSTTGWRVRNSTYDVSDVSWVYLKNPI